MSERRSWDIAPRARKSPTAGRARAVPVRRVAAPRRTAPTSSGSASNVGNARGTRGRLRDRRKRARKITLIVGLLILIALVAGALYSLWQPQLRIQEISTKGPNSAAVEALVRERLAGTYGFVIPKNSIFFYPQEQIRAAVLAQFPDIMAVSLSRDSFTSISLEATPRAKGFIWCGVSVDTRYPEGQCFEADAEGLIFAPVDKPLDPSLVAETEAPANTTSEPSPASATSSTPADTAFATTDTARRNGDLKVFAEIDRALGEGESPVGARVIRTDDMPDALRFVRAMETLGVPVESLVLRGDEADLWVNDATRITYVLGREESAAVLAASAIPTLNLTDGSIQYLDLRFEGKAYVKRHGE